MPSLNWKLLAASLILAFASRPSFATHRVSVVKAEPVSRAVRLTLMAEVLDNAADENSVPQPGRAYHLSVPLPKGVTPDLSAGSSVTVALPTIHHNAASATVRSISNSQVALVLANQVQLLEGQRLRVIIPLKPVHLFQIPFQAVYSPRGLTTQVFLVSREKRANLVPVVPLEVLPDGKMIIASDLPGDASVVVQGTDNLISGDVVQVIDRREALGL